MADKTPLGAIVSFGGTSIATLTGVASIGYPSIDRQPVEVYEQILGHALPVDFLNGTVAPRKDTFTCTVLVRADDSVTNAGSAWQAVAAGYRLLAGLPETGTLVVNNDASGGGSVSCSARRKPLPLNLTPSNARHYVATLTFVLTSDWT